MAAKYTEWIHLGEVLWNATFHNCTCLTMNLYCPSISFNGHPVYSFQTSLTKIWKLEAKCYLYRSGIDTKKMILYKSLYEFLYEAHYSHTSQIEKVPPKHKMKQTHVIATKVFFLKKKKKENCANNSKNKKEKKMKRSDKVHMTMKQEMTKTQKITQTWKLLQETN